MKGILIFLIIFGILVFVHEFGHFIVAKKCGILVREFSIGMGPKLFQTHGRQTTYTIRWLPLGGYVRLAGPDDAGVLDPGTSVVLALNSDHQVVRIDASESELPIEGIPVQVVKADLINALTITGNKAAETDQLEVFQVAHDATIIEKNGTEVLIAPLDTQFQQARPLKKLATNFAGPFMNILLGFVVFLIWSLLTVGPMTTTVQSTVNGSPARSVGIKRGDKIIAINDDAIQHFDQIAAKINQVKQKPLKLKVMRGATTKIFKLTPQKNRIQGQTYYQIGIYGRPDSRLGVKLLRGWQTSVSTTLLIFNAVGNLFRHFSLNKLSGPVGIYSQTAQVSQMGFSSILAFLAMISINLGIVNLIPIPGLDGGKLLLNVIELLIGRRIPQDKEIIVDMIGFGLLLLLIIMVTGNDIYRYFIK